MEGLAPDVEVDWVWMAQSVLRYNVVIVGKFFNKGSWMSEAWRKEHPEELTEEPECPQKECPPSKSGDSSLVLILRALCVCGLRARHLHTAFG